jgi:hypothetical protein
MKKIEKSKKKAKKTPPNPPFQKKPKYRLHTVETFPKFDRKIIERNK